MNSKEFFLQQLAGRFLAESFSEDLVFVPTGLVNGSLIQGLLGTEASLEKIQENPAGTPHAFILLPLSWFPRDDSGPIAPNELLGVRISRTEEVDTGDIILRVRKYPVTRIRERIDAARLAMETLANQPAPTVEN